jgi:hypothetical protein
MTFCKYCSQDKIGPCDDSTVAATCSARVIEPVGETPTIQEVIKEAAQGAWFDNGYSGRGMMGRKCVAISGSREEVRQVFGWIVTKIANDAVEEMMEYPYGTDDEKLETIRNGMNEAIQKVSDCHEDQWGYGIVIYWPAIPFTGDEE